MKYIITFLSILFIINLSYSQTDVSGAISSDTTWGTSGSPYTVTGNVLVSIRITGELKHQTELTRVIQLFTRLKRNRVTFSIL